MKMICLKNCCIRNITWPVSRYFHRTNTWAGVAPMAKEISALGVAELNGSLYAVGGWHRGRPLNTVLR